MKLSATLCNPSLLSMVLNWRYAGAHFKLDIHRVLNPGSSLAKHEPDTKFLVLKMLWCPWKTYACGGFQVLSCASYNSFIMLSLDFPTPTHFTRREREKSILKMYQTITNKNKTMMLRDTKGLKYNFQTHRYSALH